ncbi:enoyl-CoA hydratase [Enterovirga sp. CN4-39]|uniref:enoyl-CoA hydratase n=1 Tax=Enterovirga sp. CN4-39 TaxID=3400910 RepID=UPI003C0132C2
MLSEVIETAAPGRQPEAASLDQDLLVGIDGGVAIVTFNRPAVRNAFTLSMYQRLTTLCSELGCDPAVRVLVLTGSGTNAFCAGTDIGEFEAFGSSSDVLAYEAHVEQTLSALEACPLPTVAAIAGFCTGGGAALAGCCDIRIAASNARFGFPIARTLGNCLSLPNYARFAALVGAPRLKQMIYAAELLDAAGALRVGLVNEVLETPESLMARVGALTRAMAENAPLTIRATKEALRRLSPAVAADGADDLLLRCYMSADFREGRNAFREKRKPIFTGS